MTTGFVRRGPSGVRGSHTWGSQLHLHTGVTCTPRSRLGGQVPAARWDPRGALTASVRGGYRWRGGQLTAALPPAVPGLPAGGHPHLLWQAPPHRKHSPGTLSARGPAITLPVLPQPLLSILCHQQPEGREMAVRPEQTLIPWALLLLPEPHHPLDCMLLLGAERSPRSSTWFGPHAHQAFPPTLPSLQMGTRATVGVALGCVPSSWPSTGRCVQFTEQPASRCPWGGRQALLQAALPASLDSEARPLPASCGHPSEFSSLQPLPLLRPSHQVPPQPSKLPMEIPPGDLPRPCGWSALLTVGCFSNLSPGAGVSSGQGWVTSD